MSVIGHGAAKTARQQKNREKGFLMLRMKAALKERDEILEANKIVTFQLQAALKERDEILEANKIVTLQLQEQVQLYQTALRHIKICKDFVAQAENTKVSVQTELTDLRRTCDEAAGALFEVNEQNRVLHSTVERLRKPNPHNELFLSSKEGCISTSRARLLLALNVAPFLAFEHKLKTAEVRSQKELNIDKFFGQTGRFARGRGQEIMDFKVPEEKDNTTWKKFSNFKALQQDGYWWTKCFDVTKTEMGLKRKTWSEIDMIEFMSKFKDEPLVVFIPSFINGLVK